MMKKEEIKAKATEALTEAKSKLEELQGKRESMTAELKEEFDEKVILLKVKKKELELKLERMEDQSEEKWDEIKDVLGDSIQSFKDGFTNLGKLFN